MVQVTQSHVSHDLGHVESLNLRPQQRIANQSLERHDMLHLVSMNLKTFLRINLFPIVNGKSEITEYV